MGASLNEIKQRTASTEKTSQITKAMQMVSAAKLTKSEGVSRSFQEYSPKIRSIVTYLVAAQLNELHEIKQSSLSEGNYYVMLAQRPVKKTGYIVITSDKGLVGGYDSSILKQAMSMTREDHDFNKEYALIAIGGTGADFFKARGIDASYELRGLMDQPTFEEARKTVTTATTMYQNEVFDESYVCHNHHVNSLTSQLHVEKMLPIIDLDPLEATSYEQEYLLESSPETISDQLLPQYAKNLIYRAITDAKTAEHAIGMTSMKTAIDNAQNIISDLTTSHNRARQGVITQEITEITTGAAALEQPSLTFERL